ncbi:hypothetical protein [Bradyrhizobium sp.]
MKHSKLLSFLAVASATFFIAREPVSAQWQVPLETVPFGLGVGTGFNSDAGFTFSPSLGTLSSPSFTGTRAGGGKDSAFLASAVVPGYGWKATGQSTDQIFWDAIVSGTTLQFRAVNDANNASNTWLTATRGAGATVSGISMPLLGLGGCSLAGVFCANGQSYINSTLPNAFTVGTSGLTNPAFNVDNSATSAATGVNVTAAAAGNGVYISALSSATNENLVLNAKGTAVVATNSTFSIFPPANSLVQGLAVTQTPAGTTSPVPPAFTFTTANALNWINTPSDTVNNGDFNELTSLAVFHNFGGSTVTGQRSAFVAQAQLLSATNPASLERDVVGGSLRAYASVADNHNFIGGNSIGALFTGAGAAFGLTGHEIDILSQSGTSMGNKFGLSIIQVTGDTAQGSSADAAIALYSQSGTPGWKNGFLFTTGTVSAGGVGIDMSPLPNASLAYLFKGPGLRSYIDGSGNIGANNLNILAGSPNAIFFNGSVSGASAIVVPGVLGNQSWTLPTGSGTFVVSADSPLSISAAGKMTCSTCVVSTSLGGITVNVADFVAALTLHSTTAGNPAPSKFFRIGSLGQWEVVNNTQSAVIFALTDAGGITANTYTAGTSAGVSCSGAPTGSFASTNGIITHC